MTDSPFLTVKEVAAYLRLSESEVRRLEAAGELVALRTGRAVRIRRDSVEAYIQSHTSTGPTGGAA